MTQAPNVKRLAESVEIPFAAPYRVVSFDTETHLTADGCQAPPLVCVSLSSVKNGRLVSELLDAQEGTQRMKRVLSQAAQGELTIVGQNVAYDFGVLMARDYDTFAPLVFAALDAGQVYDTMLAEQLLDIAWGCFREDYDEDGNFIGKFGYSLESLAQRYLKLQLDKDTWRLRYKELDGVPLSQWPDEAVLYPLHDARSPLLIMHEQLQRAEVRPGVLDDLAAQARGAFGLHMAHVWGFPVDAQAAQDLDAQLLRDMKAIEPELMRFGFVKEKKGKVSRDMKTIRAAIEKAFAKQGKKAPKTKPSARAPDGQTKTDVETLQDADDDRLLRLWTYAHKQKLRGFADKMMQTDIMHPGYGMAATGRTTSFSPNIQQLPREPGLRECFVPLAGNVLSSTDYSTLELCTFAQVQLWIQGKSPLAEAINDGKDPHLMLAADLLHVSYEDAYKRSKAKDPEVKEMRQLSKAPNFGYPGGMGPYKFVSFARKSYGMRVTEQQSLLLKKTWMGRWQPKEYFDHISQLVEGRDGGMLVQFVSGRMRGNVGFTDAANSYFQGLAADGAKAATYALVKEMCLGKDSPLYGSYLRAMIHDENICEHPAEIAHEAAMRVQEIMVGTMQQYTPNVLIKAEPCLMERWTKAAEPMFENGRLVPWRNAE